MPDYAIKVGDEWSELPTGKWFIANYTQHLYQTMLDWSPQRRTAEGIKTIEETPIPEGKKSDGWRLVDRNGKPYREHMLYDEFPEVPVPESVTMRQARLALLGAGLLDAAETAIASLTGPEGRAAQIEWEYATELRRDHQLVAGIAAALDVEESAVDELFKKAKGIV